MFWGPAPLPGPAGAISPACGSAASPVCAEGSQSTVSQSTVSGEPQTIAGEKEDAKPQLGAIRPPAIGVGGGGGGVQMGGSAPRPRMPERRPWRTARAGCRPRQRAACRTGTGHPHHSTQHSTAHRTAHRTAHSLSALAASPTAPTGIASQTSKPGSRQLQNGATLLNSDMNPGRRQPRRTRSRRLHVLGQPTRPRPSPPPRPAPPAPPPT